MGVGGFLKEGQNWLYGGIFISLFAAVVVLTVLLVNTPAANHSRASPGNVPLFPRCHLSLPPAANPLPALPAALPEFSDVVTTKLGAVKGTVLGDGTRQFLGVPYGDCDRFKPSRQVQP